VGTLLFFDTETTGLPRDRRAPASNTRNWPRVVQVGWALYDPDGVRLSAEEHLVKPEGFRIPSAAARVHGITTAAAQEKGVPLGEVLSRFLSALGTQVSALVAHNALFDRNVMAAEFYRLGHSREQIRSALLSRTFRCTMEESKAFCRLPGRYGSNKAPTLAELFLRLFSGKLSQPHSALVDVDACARCFFELRKRGVIG